MADYIQRMIKERDELKAKVEGINGAITRKIVNGRKMDLLMRQQDCMMDYLFILEERLEMEGVRS